MANFTIDQLALAYELRCQGLCWKLIARQLNCDYQKLGQAVRHVMRNGITGERYEQGRPKLFSYRVLELVDELREGGLSFREIATMVEVNEEQLRTAVRHHRARLKRKKIKDRSSLEGLKAVKLVKPIIIRRNYHNELDDSNSSPASFLGL